MPINKDAFYQELEEHGEAYVRERLALGEYGDTGDRRVHAELWLATIDQGRRIEADRRSDASNFESLKIARSAKNAAWAAAISATIAIAVSIIALIRSS